MKKTSLALALSLFTFLGGCGGDDGQMATPDAGGDPGADAAPPAAYRELVTAPWTLEAGTEGYWCARVTTSEDVYINAFRPIAPAGTHHTALTIDTSGDPDGVFPCMASTIGFQILFGSGVGTTAFELPEGVAYHLPVGSKVLLNLHLYNTGDTPIEGTSGVEIRALDPAAVEHEAETIYVGNLSLTVPVGQSTQYSNCTIQEETTVFGVFPHMHQTGVNMRGVVVPAGGGADMVIHDQPYSFLEQYNYLVEPAITLVPGDVVRAECGYDNPGPDPIMFGDSSDAEMCFLGLYKYPATGSLFLCTN